jgi:hypothetical protein
VSLSSQVNYPSAQHSDDRLPLLVTALTVLGVELSFSPETYTIGSPYNFTWSRNASDPETFHLFCGVDGETYPQGTIDTSGKLSGSVTLDLAFPPIKYVMSQDAVVHFD